MGLIQVERAAGDDGAGALDLREQRRNVDAAVPRSVWREPALGLFELSRAPDRVPAAGLVPGYRDVDEPLEEVAFLGRSRAPYQLELLVRGEELAPPDQLESGLKLRR